MIEPPASGTYDERRRPRKRVVGPKCRFFAARLTPSRVAREPSSGKSSWLTIYSQYQSATTQEDRGKKNSVHL